MANVYVQVIDPAAFGGIDAFLRETSWRAAKACRETPPAPGVAAVRLPGQQASSRRRAGSVRRASALSRDHGRVGGLGQKLQVTVPTAIS